MRSLAYFWIVLTLFISCNRGASGDARQADAGVITKPVFQTALQNGWEDELQKTTEAARREGKVVIYMTAGAEVRTALVKSFGEKSGVALEATSVSGNQMSERLIRERKAGLYLADIYIGGATTPITILKPAGVFENLETSFILPELKDPEIIKRTWWDGSLLWVDQDHKVIALLAYAQDWALINTEIVKVEEIKALKDLLNPKWKGKIVMFDPTTTGAGGQLFGALATYITGLDYWREFAKQEPVILGDHRLMVEWVARAKYSIAVAPRPNEVQEFQKAGAPILLLPPPTEGIHLVAGSGTAALINQAPHPSAARLFINWLLSKEGLTIFSQAFGSPSARLDVPTNFLPPDRIRQPGVRYIWAGGEDYLVKEPALHKDAREIFGIK